MTVVNKNGETAQQFLDKGAKRQAEQKAAMKAENERMRAEEEAQEKRCEARDAKKDKDAEFLEKMAHEAAAEGLEGIVRYVCSYSDMPTKFSPLYIWKISL